MLDYSIMKPEGILVLKPQAPLSKEDFGGLSAAVDSYLSDHARLHGILILSRKFPGWENVAGFTAHGKLAVPAFSAGRTGGLPPTLSRRSMPGQ